MPSKPRNTVPTSVIITHAQRAFIKDAAEKEGRTYSGMVRWIVTSWCDFHSRKKEKPHGKESQEDG